jgi:hypothetical protein
MGDDSSPEINIPMPEPPLPGSDLPLSAYFPFGPFLSATFAAIDFLLEARFWPSWDEEEKPELWKFFPIGVPVHLVLSVVDFVYINLKRTR